MYGVVIAASIPVVAASFVPACIVGQCEDELKAFATDGYPGAIGTCAVDNFGPCASKAWDCLGDESCRSVVTCAPSVINECGDDIWKMMTDPDEREKIMCIENCMKSGSAIPDPICVATKCGKAAIQCLSDPTCIDAAVCLPKALLNCSGPALKCVLGSDQVCRENLQCLGHGVSACADPAVNFLTDARIADVISCAGSKCPHPEKPADEAVSVDADESLGQFNFTDSDLDDPAKQLLCVASKCGAKVAKILVDQDTKDLLGCALSKDLRQECSAVWDCLGDDTCNAALSCWAKPFDTCKDDVWSMFIDEQERKKVTDGLSCLEGCQKEHTDDFTEAAFCVMDKCTAGFLDCWGDDKCKSAVKCLPTTVGQCAVPQMDAYAHNDNLKKSIRCLGHGIESCGRGAVEMLRDQNIAEAVSCASQCTHEPHQLAFV